VSTSTESALASVLDEGQWRQRAREHKERAGQWIEPHLERRRRGVAHPVLDFLFDYYPYSPGRLSTWHPGLGTHLLGDWNPSSCADYYVQHNGQWTVDPERASKKRLELALSILEGTEFRPAQFSCFGMHEWAMVYRIAPERIRHSQQPLRLSIEEISETVDHVGLRCTHIDAFRFFTNEAAPRNSLVPTRANQPELEQPGCLHANMDLFKYAMWFQPYLPGELVLECFALAARVREIDMRASPYDLSELGYQAICLETPDGRQEYASQQKRSADSARILRRRLIEELLRLQDAITHAP